MSLVDFSEDGQFAPKKIAAALRTTSEEVARSVGLGKDAVQRRDRVGSDRTQRRLREMVEIINKVERHFRAILALSRTSLPCFESCLGARSAVWRGRAALWRAVQQGWTRCPLHCAEPSDRDQGSQSGGPSATHNSGQLSRQSRAGV